MSSNLCPRCDTEVQPSQHTCPACGLSLHGARAAVPSPPVNRPKRTSQHGQKQFESLFSRLGGQPVLDRAIDLFYDRLLEDDRIRHFFDGADMPRLRATQKAFLSWAFGGPVVYDGPTLREVHRHLDLTEEHFAAIAEHLRATLQELLIPGTQIDEVMSLLTGMRDDVLDR